MAAFQHLVLAQSPTQGPSALLFRVDEGQSTFNAIPLAMALSGNGDDAAYSASGQYLAVTTSASPYVKVARRFGDSYVDLPNVDVPPSNQAKGVALTSDGLYLAVSYSSSPYLKVYKRNGDQYENLSLTINPGGAAEQVAFSPDDQYLTAKNKIFKRTGDTFEEVTTISPALATNVIAMGWSPDGRYVAVVGTYTREYAVDVYERVGDNFSRVATPDVDIPGVGRTVEFSPDGQHIAVDHDSSPYLSIYSFTGTALTKLANPSPVPTSSLNRISYSADGRFLAAGLPSSPFVKVYERTGNAYAEITAPSDPLMAVCYGVRFSPNLYGGQPQLYSTAVRDLLNGTVDSSTLKIALLSSSASFTASDTTFDQVTNNGAYEVNGWRWPVGGMDLVGATYEAVAPYGAKLTFPDVGENIVGGDLTFASALIYDGSNGNKTPIAFIDLGAERTVEDGERLEFQLSADGLINFQKV